MAVDLRRRTEIFIAQAGIDRQPRSHAKIVLNEPGKICIALVLTKKSRSARTFKNIAESASILGGTLTQQEVREALKEEKARSRKWGVQHQLVPLGLSAHPKTVPPPDDGNRVLPYKRVGILKIKWLAGGADCKQILDLDSRNYRKPGWRRNSDSRRGYGIHTSLQSVESHVAKSRDVRQV